MSYLPACTIVSNNYLAMARVFAESYKEHHPGAEVFVCVVDRPSPAVKYAELPFKTIFSEELPVPAFFNFAFRYDILELNTAVKPYLLSHLREEYGLDRALYFDPDILILNTLDQLSDSLDHHAAVLTPHITRGLDDTYRPSERVIQMSGIYNLGFLGLRLDDSTTEFLEWWQDRLYRFCLHDIHNGLFVDQKWMDFAPAFLPAVDIVRDPAYNIAYWNLPHRKLQRTADGWLVNGERAGFFHFSGIVFDHLAAISKYQNRVNAGTHPEVLPLFNEYRDRVAAAKHDDLRLIPYGFEKFESSDILIPVVLRRAIQRIDPYGMRWPNPFDDTSSDSFLAWLTRPIGFSKGTLNRAALCLWEERPDLIAAFPNVWGSGLPDYVRWLGSATGEQRNGLVDGLFAGIGYSPSLNRAGRKEPIVLPFEGSSPIEPDSLGAIDLAHPGEATAWLNEPVPTVQDWPMMTRLGLKLYELRDDVQKAFPDPVGADQLAFARWFLLWASAEYHLHNHLLKPILKSFPLAQRLELITTRLRNRKRRSRDRYFPVVQRFLDGNHPLIRKTAERAQRFEEEDPDILEFKTVIPQVGVNVAGYFDAASGVGQIARGTIEALACAGIPSAKIPLDADSWARTFRGRVLQPSGAPFDITLLHVNADETARAMRMLPVTAAASSRRIGYWFWELSHFPLEFADRFDYLDELWAPTQFCRKSFEALSTIPVRYVPPCVLPPARTEMKRSRFGMDEKRFYFYFTFDVFSIPERKNPTAVIDAFLLASSRTRRDIGLIVNVNQSSRDWELVGKLRDRAKGSSIIIHTDPLSRSSVDGLMCCCDAYISLHRSEGLGLPPIEALYLGKPVVGTEYGGVTDFLDSETGFPVRYDLVRLDSSHPPYPAGAVWAEPDVDHAAELILRVVEDPQESARRAEAGQKRVRAIYGPEAASERFQRELQRLFAPEGLVDHDCSEAGSRKMVIPSS